MPLPVLGNMGHPSFQNIARGGMADRLAHDADLSADHRCQAGQCVHQLRLTVALHACNAQNLACPYIKGCTIYR